MAEMIVILPGCMLATSNEGVVYVVCNLIIYNFTTGTNCK